MRYLCHFNGFSLCTVEAVPVLSRVFSVGPLPLPGDSDTPMLAGIIAAKPFNVGGWCTHWRMCIDMGIAISCICAYFAEFS